jgi:endonuclease/exonuclease/phosphatase family metal-dependent hydrolase
VSRNLKREFSSPMRRMRRTHPAVFPLFALDRLYWDVELEGQEFHVHRSRLARVASDHRPIVATLRVRRVAGPRAAAPYVTGEALPPSE